jgi:hypothetical protein
MRWLLRLRLEGRASLLLPANAESVARQAMITRATATTLDLLVSAILVCHRTPLPATGLVH